jgi:hypothetical protein
LQASFIGHHMPAAEGFVVAAIAVQGDTNVHIAGIQLLGRLGQAASTAPNTTSRSTFFSREIASTSINSSRFMP